VRAAAITSGATLLITDNVDDFPPTSTQRHGVEVVTADQFLLELLDAAPTKVVATLTARAEQYKREPKTLEGLPTSLNKSGLPGFANEVRRHIL
jgi:hypothetical protein